MYVWVDECMDGWMEGRTGTLMIGEGWMGALIDRRWTDGRMDELMGLWVDDRHVDRCTDGWMY